MAVPAERLPQEGALENEITEPDAFTGSYEILFAQVTAAGGLREVILSCRDSRRQGEPPVVVANDPITHEVVDESKPGGLLDVVGVRSTSDHEYQPTAGIFAWRQPELIRGEDGLRFGQHRARLGALRTPQPDL